MEEKDILEERKSYLTRIFNSARLAGMCKTQKDFADLLGMDRATISSGMNGSKKALTESLHQKVRFFAIQNDLDDQDFLEKKRKEEGGFYIPEKTAKMYENMTETIRIQAQLLAQYQSAAIAGGFPQKNDPSTDPARK